jgi:hypothetical protein
VNYSYQNDEGQSQDVIYSQKPQGEMNAGVTVKPEQSGLPENMLATIVEYGAVKDCPYQELLLLERGDAENPDGGLINLFLGSPIRTNEFSILFTLTT